ncbi:MAG: D-lysine 5,6-aminomutase subunit alpha [Proteobacteria bacterium]|nr:MAG: D-lysine 5,6-aminomutase subunit alpha [Pseudomonadota bacterium]
MKLALDKSKIALCRKIAGNISRDVSGMINEHSTVASERSVLRLIGVEGAKEIAKGKQFYPLANVVVDQLHEASALGKGASFWMANACLHLDLDPAGVAEAVLKSEGSLRLAELPLKKGSLITKKADALAKDGLKRLVAKRKERNLLIKKLKNPHDPTFKKPPMKYVIVASGNIFEDVVQARSAAQAGADVIAVIRSTAQSLLDYVPHGATTEGFGGTYATQENFRIMRKALDEESINLGRYVRLTNYSSGLCMPEIATIAAQERLDFLLCDSLYGILFRDINMKRTLVDQHFSRLICALSEIFINTGEDNYLTTADAVENGHQVLASQFINERFALSANMKEEFMGLGHAMEMDPWHPDGILLEIARAQMTRDIFPKAPLKYMPPTRHMEGDIFFGHVYDAMFNLVSVMTNQGIHLLGMPTEAIHTPLLGDRYMALKSCNYIFNGAESLGAELTFKKNGKIEKWSQKVLADSVKLLQYIDKVGLFEAIEKKAFAEVSRRVDGGKGYKGVFTRDDDYLNPTLDRLEAQDYGT